MYKMWLARQYENEIYYFGDSKPFQLQRRADQDLLEHQSK